jgi:hypothetical protein
MQKQSQLGLQQPFGSTAARKRGALGCIKETTHTTPEALPKREGPVWATVKVLSEHATSPSLQCVNGLVATLCGWRRTRIKDHITGDGALACCPCKTDTCGDGWLREDPLHTYRAPHTCTACGELVTKHSGAPVCCSQCVWRGRAIRLCVHAAPRRTARPRRWRCALGSR